MIILFRRERDEIKKNITKLEEEQKLNTCNKYYFIYSIDSF